METCQIFMHERCKGRDAATRHHRVLIGATAPGELGITPLARVARLVAACAFLVALTSFPVWAQPATFTVNSTADGVDTSPGNGFCQTTTGECTLRGAIQETNARAFADTIVFDSSVFNVPQTITLGSPLPAIAQDLRIVGPTAHLTVDASPTIGSVFEVNSSVTADISGLAVTGGRAGTGGGIANRGTLTLTKVTVKNNQAFNVFGLPGSFGGGIYNDGGTLTLKDSTISDNAAHVGGGMYNINGSTVILNDSTVSGNSGGGGPAGIYNNGGPLTLNNSTLSDNTSSINGGGIYNLSGGILILNNSTVHGNTAGAQGAIWNDSLAVTKLKNTIVANNLPYDCAGPITSLGYNLSSDATCAFGVNGDLNSTNPLLGPLQNNGGPTETHALLTGSPAIDAGNPAGCTDNLGNPLTTDQRGVVRPQGAVCDIGAYENGCVPPPSGMVAWWPLDEFSGATSFVDLIGGNIGGNNATPFASPVDGLNAPKSVPGVVDGAIEFRKFGNGFSGARVTPSLRLNNIGSADFTIDAWVKFDPGSPANEPHYIVNKFDNAGASIGYALYIISPGIPNNERLEFKWASGIGNTVQTISTLAPGQWYFVAVTVTRNVGGNALDIRLYVNGVEEGAQLVGSPVGSLVNFLFLEIGWQPGTIDEPITIDELEIFDRALTQTEVEAIYRASSAGKCRCRPTSTCPNGAEGITLGGIADDFAPSPLDPLPNSVCPAPFDATQFNQPFCHTIQSLPPNLGAATLEIRLRNLGNGNPCNDTLSLQSGSSVWSRSIGTGPTGCISPFTQPGLLSSAWDTFDERHTFCLDLAALPQSDGSLFDLLSFINTGNRLDISVQDDTAVDYVRLHYIACPCTASPPDMVAWWPFDEPSGAVAGDIASFPNDGNYVNGPAISPGKVDRSLCFDGVDESVRVPNHSEINFLGNCINDVAEPFTIDTWVKTGADGLQVILDKRETNNVDFLRGYSLFIVDGRLGFQMATGTGNLSCGAPGSACTNFVSPVPVGGVPDLRDNLWHFIAVTVTRCQQATGKMYIDGDLVHTFTPMVGDISNSVDLLIGERYPISTTINFEGCLDELEFFKRELSEPELDAIYDAGAAGKCRCKPLLDGSGCTDVGCGCFGECIDGGYCDDPNCCLVPGDCLCYSANSQESIKRCGDCFGECTGGSYCDDPLDPPSCWTGGGGPVCWLQNQPISIYLCGDCFGQCINGGYCDHPDPDCWIEPGSLGLCYDATDPISIKMCGQQDDCRPSCVNYDPVNDITIVTDCDCGRANECHATVPEQGAGPPTCVDGCPPGETCVQTESDNVNGTIDICCRCDTCSQQDDCNIESPTFAAAPHNIPKIRYISIDPRGENGLNFGWNFDIGVTLTSTLVNGVTAVGSQWWANEPDANCISIVGPNLPISPPNWDACPTLHLTGCTIIPTSEYDIVAVDGSTVSDPPSAFQTQAKPGVKWHGDAVGLFDGVNWTPPQGSVNIDDAVAAIKTFQDPSGFNATHVSVTDVHPNLSGTQINKVVNFDDVFVQILGFQGFEYPGTDLEQCPDP